MCQDDQRQVIVLGEKLLRQFGPYRQLRRYIQGQHPDLGQLHIGLSKGWETVWEVDSFKPWRTFQVIDGPETK